jgi:hypothetical protein
MTTGRIGQRRIPVMNPRLTGLVIMMITALACVYFTACNDARERQPHGIETHQQMTRQTSLPNQKNPDKLKESPAHGVLSPPHFNTALTRLSDHRLELFPVITNISLKGGRYSHPYRIGKNRFAVAALRGVDFFEHDESHSPKIDPYLQIDTPGDAWSLEKVGSTLWVADGYAGVSVLNIDTGEPLVRWPEFDHARAFHRLHDGRIVICRHRNGADIVTVDSSGTKIQKRVHINAEERVFSATSHGDRLFIGTLGAGYRAYDLDGDAVEHRWTYPDCTRIVWCTFVDGIHYLLDQDTGLLILEDHPESTPRLLGSLALPDQTRQACFTSRNQMALANRNGLFLADVTFPERPRIIQHVPAKLEGRGVAALDNQLVFAESEYGVRILQVEQDRIQDSAIFEQNGLVTDVVSANTAAAFVTNTGRGVALLQVDAGEDVRLTSRWQNLHYPVAVDIQGSIAAVADYEGLLLLELDQNTIVRDLARIRTPGRAVNVLVDGNYVYVSDWFEGVHIVDIQHVSRPVIRSTIPTRGWAVDVAVKNTYAYICSVTEGLLIFDISDPSHPHIIGTDDSAQAPEAVAVTGETLYVADFNFGLIIFDLRDPGKPLPSACFSLNVCKNVEIQGDLLIVSNYIEGVKWFDISQPLKPVLVGELDTPGKSYGVTFLPFKNEILVADWHGLLRVKW